MKYLDNSITYSCMNRDPFSILRHVFHDRWYIPYKADPFCFRKNTPVHSKSLSDSVVNSKRQQKLSFHFATVLCREKGTLL